METRDFGSTGMRLSAIGFGAWGIGGPAMAGSIPIGWGPADDSVSIAALRRAYERGVTFYDTADFYGLGHSEELIGRVFGNRPDITVATKVGHRLQPDNSIATDYSREYILTACEESLRRLQRDRIDLYQLHSARLAHLQQAECIEAMERLKEQGKIRAWGLSLNTFAPEPEATYLMDRRLGNGFQLVLNILNQRAVPLLERARSLGYGIIARMPFQFGLLTGKFTPQTRFTPDDHRSFRLKPEVLERALQALEPVWPIAREKQMHPTAFSLSFCLSPPGVSTVIPGIKTSAQADANTSGLHLLDESTMSALRNLYSSTFAPVVSLMEKNA
jgi:aryl-alcohol dehydrogenase-like predicted oxidoreductase